MNRLAEIIQWPAAPARLRLAAGEIHVWAASLAVPQELLRDLASVLEPAETARAAKFRFDRHRNRFIAGRGMLRKILSRYTASAPAELGFTYSTAGKPALSSATSGVELHFNLAHSDDLAGFAVTAIGPVGIDVEQIRLMKDMDDLVARFFSPRENEQYQRLAPAEKPPAFFNLWTRKEALLKATGEGIAGGLNRVEVSFLPTEPARLVAIGGDALKAAEWFLFDLAPAPQFAGAVAVHGKCSGVRCWQWETTGV